jgi:hypothetical protein
MGKIVREYWAWVVVPFILVIALVAYLVLAGGPDDSVTPFTYAIF